METQHLLQINSYQWFNGIRRRKKQTVGGSSVHLRSCRHARSLSPSLLEKEKKVAPTYNGSDAHVNMKHT